MFFAYRIMNAGDSSSSPPLSSRSSVFLSGRVVPEKNQELCRETEQSRWPGRVPHSVFPLLRFFPPQDRGRTARKLGYPQVLQTLLAPHAPSAPGRTILSITILPGVAQQKATVSFKALQKYFTAGRHTNNARLPVLPNPCPHITTSSSPASGALFTPTGGEMGSPPPQEGTRHPQGYFSR